VDFADGLRRTVAYFTEGHDDDAARPALMVLGFLAVAAP